MSDISELETRITTALERIGLGLAEMGPASSDTENETAKVQLALDEERTVNAQLEERLHGLKDQHQTALSELQAELARLRDQVSSEEKTLTRLRKVNADLRANNDALRSAASDGVVEPHLINKSMMAELEGLRAAQAADRAELDSVLGELGAVIADQGRVSPDDAKENADA